jgi:hypothetical protein
MEFDPLQLWHETTKSVGDCRFNVACEVFATVDVIVGRDMNEHDC